MKSLVLLAMLLVILFTASVSAQSGEIGLSLRVFYLAAFCFAGYLLFTARSWVIAYLAIALPALALGLLKEAWPEVGFLIFAASLSVAALKAMLFVAVIRFSLYQRGVRKADRIVAGICGYLLLGFFWSDFYAVTMPAFANGFQTVDGLRSLSNSSETLYFSFVTLTTLGYGDIAPAHRTLRILAVFEAICGTLYLAIFISSLVARQGPDHGSS